jgi:hypothetical protein
MIAEIGYFNHQIQFSNDETAKARSPYQIKSENLQKA